MGATRDKLNECLNLMFDRGYEAGEKQGTKTAETGDYAALSMLLMLYYIHDPDMIELLEKKKGLLKEQYYLADELRRQRNMFEEDVETNVKMED